MFIVTFENEQYSSQIEYVFLLLLSVINIEYVILGYSKVQQENVADYEGIISYGKRKYQHNTNIPSVHIYEGLLFSSDYLKLISLPKLPLNKQDNIIAIYKGEGKLSKLIQKTNKKTLETNIDIVASAFFMVTRYEEMIIKKRDVHGRFQAKDSVAYKEGFLNIPVVNVYIYTIIKWLKEVNNNQAIDYRSKWGENQWGFCLTHDIDLIHGFKLKSLFGKVLKKITAGKINTLGVLLKDYYEFCRNKQDDPYNTLGYIKSLNKQYGFKSTFYLIVNNKTKYPGDYSISSPKVRDIINSIKDEGYEIGLHSSYNTYNNSKALGKEKKIMDKVSGESAIGCRQHFLRFQIPDTWQNQNKAGIYYDSSMGYPEQIGFRSGLCFPYKPFDLIENKEIDIWEVPLIMMDGTLVEEKYMGLSREEALLATKELINTIKIYKGVFVLLWHNHTLSDYYWQGWRSVYEDILDYIHKSNAKSMTVKKMLNDWES